MNECIVAAFFVGLAVGLSADLIRAALNKTPEAERTPLPAMEPAGVPKELIAQAMLLALRHAYPVRTVRAPKRRKRRFKIHSQRAISQREIKRVSPP